MECKEDKKNSIIHHIGIGRGGGEVTEKLEKFVSTKLKKTCLIKRFRYSLLPENHSAFLDVSFWSYCPIDIRGRILV